MLSISKDLSDGLGIKKLLFNLKSKDFYELATFYEDFTNKKYDFFKFQIDNNDPWIDDSPEYDNGWLMSNISNYTEQAASEIEKEMRAAASNLEFEEAAKLRDIINRLQQKEIGLLKK